MRSTRKNRPIRALGVYVDEDLWNRMDAYCTQTGVSKTFVVSRALSEYLDRVDVNNSCDGNADGKEL